MPEEKSLTQIIEEENTQLAEIEQVVRFDGKSMFLQWLSVSRYLFAGMAVVFVMNLIIGRLGGRQTGIRDTLTKTLKNF